MPKFNVRIVQKHTWELEVNAENKDAALDLAYQQKNIFDPSPDYVELVEEVATLAPVEAGKILR